MCLWLRNTDSRGRSVGAAHALAHAESAPLPLMERWPFRDSWQFTSICDQAFDSRCDSTRSGRYDRCAHVLLTGHGLAGLAADHLAVVANALAFVRLRLADRPDFGGELADHLLVDPLDHDVRLIGAGDFQARRESAYGLRWRIRREAATRPSARPPDNRRRRFPTSFRSPCVTPTTMFCTSARVSPCSAWACRVSSLRVTTTLLGRLRRT